MSQAEPELGMGTLVSCDKRSIDINFPGADCRRRYSLNAAPIRRVIFKAGDRITDLKGNDLTVVSVEESCGILTYVCGKKRVRESELAPFLAADLPQERLLTGLAGESRLFEMRKQIRYELSRYQSSPARGFLGGQVDLIPHQFYIADQVSRRYFPRVLLSDETGLGKTIEAALIIHRLLVTGQIQRVLVIVPDALVHQWFIELFRKFNFKFTLFNQENVLGEGLGQTGQNPFADAQQGIVSQTLVQKTPKLHQWILDAGWDMVIMDEAHHMTENPDFYGFMQRLARQTKGMMLLSATPEQMGPETHFAQLQLLDPDRYYDFDRYTQEAESYERTAEQARQCMAQGQPVDTLLDSFGPGRAVFRNRRASIKGFPGRKVILTPLDSRPEYPYDSDACQDLGGDPRVIYLAHLAKQIKPEKILVICKTPETAKAVHRGVQEHIAVDAALFDETMSLLQRDRQAAWFARKDGARLLICSEIGSEGRNFQFVSHLFLFDLPDNPELLEQRIGRVDRIGQKNTIQVHVPYIKAGEHEILARWYAKGLPLLANNINGLSAIHTRFKDRLDDITRSAAATGSIDETALVELIETAGQYTRTTQEKLDRGKHILLELNSFRPAAAKILVDAVKTFDQDTALPRLMETLLDTYGVDMDLVSEKKREKITALTMDRIADEAFPSLPHGSETVTFDRATAIAREELTFLTWDHPFVSQVMEFYLTQGQGMAAVAVYSGDLGPGLFLETLYLLEIPGIENHPAALGFVKPEPIHILIDHMGQTPTGLPDNFYKNLAPDRPGWFMDIEGITDELIPGLLEKTIKIAEAQAATMRQTAQKNLDQTLGAEIERLNTLKLVNTDITDQEIQAAVQEYATLEGCLKNARIRLDALRLIRSE